MSRTQRFSVFDRAAVILLSGAVLEAAVLGGSVSPAQTPLVRVTDVNVGESQTIELHDGSRATIKLLDLKETRDNVNNAVRRAVVTVEVNRQTVSLVSSTYHLPTTVAGVQIDCPVTKGYVQKSSKENPWGLTKDARLRLWPAGSAWMEAGTFVYPVKQCWFATDTQMANVPVFVDGGSAAGPRVQRTYDKPGEYNEIVKITDAAGNVDYDFAVVQILDRNHPDQLPSTIHAAYYPTFDIKPGDEITFKVRSFRTRSGSEIWDFGDGSARITVQSDGNAEEHNPQGYAVTTHRYKAPGQYIATVRRSNERGEEAITHLQICVGRGG